jgi:glutamine synthetase
MNTGIDFTKTPLNELYGRNCFSESIMRERLPKSVFKELKRVRRGSANSLSTSPRSWPTP